MNAFFIRRLNRIKLSRILYYNIGEAAFMLNINSHENN